MTDRPISLCPVKKTVMLKKEAPTEVGAE